MIIDKLFDITHDLRISLMSGFRHMGDGGVCPVCFPGCGGLGVEDEGHGEETLKFKTGSIGEFEDPGIRGYLL